MEAGQRRPRDGREASKAPARYGLHHHHPTLTPTPVLIGLGSNINPEKNLHAVAEMLQKEFSGTRFSHVYASAPMERTDQEDFLNAVGVFESEESPEAIKKKLESIEKALGKNPPHRFGPRTIDVDLLLFGNLVLPDAKTWMTGERPATSDQRPATLTIPHPKMHERRFVLEPLLELIDPTTLHPVLSKSFAEFLQGTSDQACARTTIVL